MKKNIFKHLLLCLPMLAGLIMSSCSEDDVVFDSELPQFELKADKVLLEVLVPSSTLAEDELFICGDWNKTEEGYAQDAQWQLTRSTSAPGRAEYKWGIYLDPSVNLGAGYTFLSKAEGMERTVFNTDTLHTVNPGVGHRANIVVNRWESFFKSEEDVPEIEHDGYVVYVDDQTGWDDLTLYMWGDTNDLNGGWPGMSVTGEVTLNGIKLKYFDMGEANTGLNENLIFNNGGNGAQLADFNFTIDRDVYLRITESGVEEFELVPTIKHDGYAVFVDNQTTWEDPITLYMWGDENDLNGGWPGMAATGTQTIGGVEYTYFDLGAANEGLNENLIFNNSGNGKQLPDFNFTIERDVYLVITDKGVTEVEPGQKADPDPTPDPTPDPQPAGKHKFYLVNNAGWDAVYVYAWSGAGGPEICGGWPGSQFSGNETIDGVDYIVAEFDANDGEYHFIINNGNGTQFDDVVVGPANVDYTKTLTADGVSSRRRAKARK